MFKLVCLLLLLFCATSCVSGGDGGLEDTTQHDKPPINDDKKQYKENLIDFSGMPMTQYLAENNDVGVNVVTIKLNQVSAKILATKDNKGQYRVNVKLLAGQKNVSNKQLITQDCNFDINNNKISCPISFYKFTAPEIYTLSFSYDGIDQAKQILLYVADRKLEFQEASRDEIHKKAKEYHVSLIFHTDLAADNISIPLSVTDGLCVIDTTSNGSGSHPDGLPCLEYPVCEYDAKSDTTSRACIITYTVRDTITHNAQDIGIYQPNEEENRVIKSIEAKSYFPKVCAINGIELYNDNYDENKEPLSSVVYMKKTGNTVIRALFCDASQDATEEANLTLTKNNTTPIINFESAIWVNNKSDQITSANIKNGDFAAFSLEYNPSTDPDIKDKLNKFARMDMLFHGVGAQVIKDKTLNVINADAVPFLRMAEESKSIDQNDQFDSPIGHISFFANQKSLKNVYIKGFNIKGNGDNQLYLRQCLHLEDSDIDKYKDCAYDYDDMTDKKTKIDISPNCNMTEDGTHTNICITKFTTESKIQASDPTFSEVKITDLPLSVKISQDESGAAESDISPVKLPDDPKDPAPGEETAYLKSIPIKEGVRYHLQISAENITQLPGVSLDLKFGYQNTGSNTKTLFNSGKLGVEIKPQAYLVLPKEVTIPVSSGVTSSPISKFFVTVTQGILEDDDRLAGNPRLRLVAVDPKSLNENGTIFNVYHMVAEDTLTDDGYVIPGDNSNNKCYITAKDKSDGCWCYFQSNDESLKCNFEIKTNIKKDIQLKFVDYATGSPIGVDQIIKVKPKFMGPDLMFVMRDKTFFEPDSTFRLDWEKDKITVVKKETDSTKTTTGGYAQSVFTDNPFFAGNGYFVESGVINIFNFPGKVDLISKDSVDTPKMRLYSTKGCYSHNGAKCEQERKDANYIDKMADSITCTIPDKAMSISSKQGEEKQYEYAWYTGDFDGTEKNSAKVFESDFTAILNTEPYLGNSEITFFNPLTGSMSDTSYWFDPLIAKSTKDKDPSENSEKRKVNKNFLYFVGPANIEHHWYGDHVWFNFIESKYRLNIQCVTTKKDASSVTMDDYALSQRNDTRGGSKICFGLKQQYINDGNKLCGGSIQSKSILKF